jgi:hypothetical protein
VSGNIEYYRDAAIGRNTSRQVGRSLARINGRASVEIAQVDARAEVQAAVVDAMTAVTQRGLQGAAYITNVEMSLAEATPAAMARLKMIGDVGSMALTQIVMDTACKLRRI